MQFWGPHSSAGVLHPEPSATTITKANPHSALFMILAPPANVSASVAEPLSHCTFACPVHGRVQPRYMAGCNRAACPGAAAPA